MQRLWWNSYVMPLAMFHRCIFLVRPIDDIATTTELHWSNNGLLNHQAHALVYFFPSRLRFQESVHCGYNLMIPELATSGRQRQIYKERFSIFLKNNWNLCTPLALLVYRPTRLERGLEFATHARCWVECYRSGRFVETTGKRIQRHI